MNEQSNEQRRRKGVIAFAIFAAFILYVSGVFSGLYAKDVILEETASDISKLKQETQKDLSDFKVETTQDLVTLSSYINFLETNLNSMQLEGTFAETLNDSQQCEYSRIALDELVKQLGYYWGKLPFRLEEYERENQPTPEYQKLKDEYTHLSIRVWILAKTQSEKCNSNIVSGLHFYSRQCEKCVDQGEQIDRLKRMVEESGKELLLFPIDFNSDEQIITNIKRFYSINETPALVINDKVFQGRLFEAEELAADISGK